MVGLGQGPMQAQQLGANASMAGKQQLLTQMPAWQRELAAIDPSLLMVAAGKRMPGVYQSYQNMNGEQFSPGFLGGLLGSDKSQGWGYNTPGGFKNV
jgi:hypothetical protein